MSDGNTVVELCAGYGGLFMGLNAVTGAQLAAYAEIDPGASAIMKHHHPDVPNLGDVKTIGWSGVQSPRWLIGGYPCQPFSAAGRKLGAADPRHLWPFFVPAIATLRPDFVLFENVRGHVKRGLSEVLADLTELGYGGAWTLLKASDVGAPHQRTRVFILGSRHVAPGFTEVKAGPSSLAPGAAALLPTPMARDGKGRSSRRRTGGDNLPSVAFKLFPTPEAKLAHSGPDYARMSRPNSGGHDLTTAVHLLPENGWGEYAPAVSWWEHTTRRAAPLAVVAGERGGKRLNPAFSEWMIGVDPGHVTAVPGLDVHDQHRAIGNGVVPLQASYAVSVLMRTLSQLPRKVYAL